MTVATDDSESTTGSRIEHQGGSSKSWPSFPTFGDTENRNGSTGEFFPILTIETDPERTLIPRFLDEATGGGETTEKFGPLKASLGAIPAVYANQDVRLHLIGSNRPLTNTFSGSRRRRKQGRGSHLAYSRIGEASRLAPG